ncbi:hypothetical protein GSQ54_22135, partial [Clostridioides difficile]|nr:hypothetical protein [Clostridioides difficile]
NVQEIPYENKEYLKTLKEEQQEEVNNKEENTEQPDNNLDNTQKDELFENLKEKYNDQIQDGKTEQEAYNSVISGIGDLSELIES